MYRGRRPGWLWSALSLLCRDPTGFIDDHVEAILLLWFTVAITNNHYDQMITDANNSVVSLNGPYAETYIWCDRIRYIKKSVVPLTPSIWSNRIIVVTASQCAALVWHTYLNEP